MNDHVVKAIKRGFTVVELAVIMVVIAILAMIVVSAYTNIQNDAKNSAIINAAEQVVKSVKSYVGSTGEYPLTVASGNISACTTELTGCMDASSTFAMNTTLTNNIKNVVGILPTTIPKVGSVAYGIRYNYHVSRTYNGVSQPVVVQYFLIGENVDCRLPRVATSSWTSMTASTTGYYNSGTYSDGKTYTQCIVSIPGPEL